MSVKPSKIYPFALGALESLPLMVQGSYFKILSSTGMVDVTGDTFGTVEAMLAGQGLRGQDFRRLVIRDRSGSGNVVRLLVSDDQFVDDRISGEVSVIDALRARAASGAAFVNSSALGAGAGVFAKLQLWNPAGSGQRLVLSSVANDGTTSVSVAAGNAPDGTAFNGSIVLSKLTGGAAGVAQIRSDNPASYVTPDGLRLNPGQFKFNEPFVIAPGFGVSFVATVSATTIRMTLEWSEERI